MANAEALIRSHHLRLTAQRRAVLDLILDHPGRHWSADQIREHLRPTMPELARGTTYKTLNELVKHEILEELATVDGSVLYGLRLEPHQHFVCELCRRWYDLPVAGIEHLQVSEPHSHQITSVAITFRGICSQCRAASAPSSIAPGP
jgi:Fe2+ or Zn2+ uptake regulation protein